MKKISFWLMAGALLCSTAFAPDARATGKNELPIVKAEKTLSDFLPIQEEAGKDRMEYKNGRAKDKARGHFKKKWEEKREHMLERIEDMPPEDREEALKKMEEMKEKREAIKKELESLPPEEREARMKELREEFKDKRAERHEKFREKFQERWDNASEEERAEFCKNARERCSGGGERACEFAKKSCTAE